MLGHVASPEYAPTAKRAVCAGCGKVKIPHEETDKGPLCRNCVSAATTIRIDYVISGRVFSKFLRGNIAAVPSRPHRAKGEV